MKYLTFLAAALSLLLAGCATAIRSDVIAFHEWPSGIQDKSYIFEAPSPREDTLEYRSYQNLVRAKLGQQGFVDAGARPAMAKLTVAMHFATIDQPVRVLQAVDPFWPTPYYRYYPYRPWGWRGFYGPQFYDPFWNGPPDYRETIRHTYERKLHVSISAMPGGKKLFDVEVQNVSWEKSTPAVMPALVHSAFADFPGPSGVMRKVALKRE